MSEQALKIKNKLHSILIVDDEPLAAKALKRSLHSITPKIEICFSASQALEKIHTQTFDIVLSDMQMPNVSGAELLAQVAKHYPETICAAISGGCANADILTAINQGKIAYFFSKPWDDLQLKLVIKNLLDKKDLEQEKEQLRLDILARSKELEILANVDALTGLANRRAFDERLQSELRRMARQHQPLTLLMCDIDYFKSYNDQLGHVQGDECLKQVASVIKKVFRRAGDFPARYGGEEFAVILPNTYWDENCQQLVEQLRQALFEEHILHPQPQVSERVTLSIGVASKLIQQKDFAKELIQQADEALYCAKLGGRDRVNTFN